MCVFYLTYWIKQGSHAEFNTWHLSCESTIHTIHESTSSTGSSYEFGAPFFALTREQNSHALELSQLLYYATFFLVLFAILFDTLSTKAKEKINVHVHRCILSRRGCLHCYRLHFALRFFALVNWIKVLLVNISSKKRNSRWTPVRVFFHVAQISHVNSQYTSFEYFFRTVACFNQFWLLALLKHKIL